MSVYHHLLRPLLFRLNAETAHHLTVEACRVAGRVPFMPALTRACLDFTAPELQTEVAGLKFANPVGLAAGWDKSGRALRMIDHLGFGFVEIGSISARSSRGNPQPRLFRLPQDDAIVVHYGLPNDGAEAVAARLANYRTVVPLGVNIVSTNDGPAAPPKRDDEVLNDYATSVSLLHPHADYVTLNLSCPNTKDGQEFFAVPGTIERLLQMIAPLNIACPLFLKVAPRLDPASVERLIAELEPFPIVHGLIYNLPPGKPETLQITTRRDVWQNMPGAVSGRPVTQLINACLREFHQRMPRGRFVLIAAGGVYTAEDAYLKIRLGASLVQIYTALVYAGPGVIRRINRGLVTLLQRDGFKNVSEAVGVGP